MPSARPPKLAVDEGGAQTVAAALDLNGFFPEFNAALCAKVFPRSGMHEYADGELLVEQGESGRDLFIILSGSVLVTLSMGSAVAPVATLGRGDLLGEIGLLSDGERRASAVAEGSVLAFRMDFADMGYLITNNPVLASHLQALARERSK